MSTCKVVIFTKNNARIKYMEDASEWAACKYAVIDPSLDKVVGVPPHFWKLVSGEVMPMSEAEKTARTKDHELNGVNNDVGQILNDLVAEKTRNKYRTWILVTFSILAALVAAHLKGWF